MVAASELQTVHEEEILEVILAWAISADHNSTSAAPCSLSMNAAVVTTCGC